MQYLVVLVSVAVALANAALNTPQTQVSDYQPVVTAQGFLVDTPEVAAAKERHFAEYARVQSYSPPAQYQSFYSPSAVTAPSYNPQGVDQSRYYNNGPPAAQYQNYNAQSAPSDPSNYNAPPADISRYYNSGPPAGQYQNYNAQSATSDPSNYNAPPADTSRYNNASPSSDYSRYYNYITPAAPVGPTNYNHYNNYPSPSVASRYVGPLAYPTVLPSGYLAETPEVAAAREAHFTEVNRALSADRWRGF